ncbi:hypothetical protein pEaSNUABM21_00128 [Erwinia phage pEa_SNUABM_21]|nr:hypothetical protein pEaSNUABM21_00128 [Erwinia phage pEa_SNUABM_21]
MHFDVYCGADPTAEQCEAIRALMSRTMKKVSKPFFAHTLCLTGPFRSQALAALSHGGCNVATKKPGFLLKYAIVIGGPAPKSFMQNRRQVLICPAD